MLEFSKYNNVIGIYRFRNKINNKSYIGLSINIGKRIREHISALSNPDRLYSIHKAILKYGINNFEISVLSLFEMRENIRKILNEAEKIYIYIYDSFNNGYNETTGGDSLGGRKWTLEQKEHMKHVMTGKKRPKDYIDPRSKPVYLYNHITGKYFYIPGAKFVYTIDGLLCGKDVLACASGRQVSTKGYVCAYSKEELEYKIQNTKFGKRCRLK